MAFTQGSDSSHLTKYCGTQDLTLDQPTTASSTQDAADYPASAATDGDPGSRWSSASSDPQWLKVDLGSPQQICRVGIAWEAAYAKAYKVQVLKQLNQPGPRSTPRRPGPAGTRRSRHHDRPLHPHVRDHPRDPVGRLDLRARRLRPDHHRPAHRRQRQRRQRRLPLGRLHRAGRQPGPAGAQHHGPGRRAHPGRGRRRLVLIGQIPAVPNLCIPATNLEDGPNGVGDGPAA